MHQMIQTTSHSIFYFESRKQQLSLDLQVDHVGYSTHSPGDCTFHDFRPHHILHYVASGKGTFTCLGKTTRLQAGDVYLFPKETYVDYQADRQDPWSVWYFSFYGNRDEYYMQHLGLSPSHIRLPHGPDPELAALFQNMLLAAQKPMVTNTLLIGHMMLILGKLMQDNPASQDLAMPSDAYHAIKSYIRDNLSAPLRVSQLAQLFHISQSQLFRVFKAHTDYSPQQYIERQRIRKAKDLIAFTEEPLQEISLKCGYAYESHFYKSFVKITGTTPAKYKKEQQK